MEEMIPIGDASGPSSGASESTVVGLVDEHGLTASERGVNRWALVVRLRAWRFIGGPVQYGPLRLEMHFATGRGYPDTSAHGIRAFGLVRATLTGSLADGSSSAILPLGAVTPTQEDPELERVSADLRAPIVMPIGPGSMSTFVRAGCEFEATCPWIGRELTVVVPSEDDVPSPTAVDCLRALLSDAPGWTERCKAIAAERLIDLYNSEWRHVEEELPELDVGAFSAALHPRHLRVYEDARFGLGFFAGEMFLGHDVWVEGSITSGPTTAGLL